MCTETAAKLVRSALQCHTTCHCVTYTRCGGACGCGSAAYVTVRYVCLFMFACFIFTLPPSRGSHQDTEIKRYTPRLKEPGIRPGSRCARYTLARACNLSMCVDTLPASTQSTGVCSGPTSAARVRHVQNSHASHMCVYVCSPQQCIDNNTGPDHRVGYRQT